MAPRANTAEPDTEPTAPMGQSVPPDPATVYRQVASLALFLQPMATAVRIQIDTPAGVNTVAVPLPDADGDDLESRVLAVLAKLRPGDWMKGRSIASELDMEYEGGHFRLVLSRMAKAEKIESSRTQGYRLPKG